MSQSYKFILIVICVILVGFTVLPYKYKWLLLYGSDAEGISKSILNNKHTKLPDWALDFSISANNTYVVFSNHDHKNLFAYSNKLISDKRIMWEHVYGNWYHYEH